MALWAACASWSPWSSLGVSLVVIFTHSEAVGLRLFSSEHELGMQPRYGHKKMRSRTKPLSLQQRVQEQQKKASLLKISLIFSGALAVAITHALQRNLDPKDISDPTSQHLFGEVIMSQLLKS